MCKKYFFIILLFLTGCSSLSSNFVPKVYFFSGPPAINKVSKSITDKLTFTSAPNPHIKVLNYEATEIPSQKKYSQYQISLIKTKNKLTEYKTLEVTKGNTRLYGHGIGYGGIFSIQYLKQGDLYNFPNYYKKYQWLKISNLKGLLFPLKVGNKLSFNYVELYKNKMSDKIHSNHGKIIYKVIGKLSGYQNIFTGIPGEIYIITFSKSINNKKLTIQNTYYFSTKLGWYVFAKYYFDEKARVQYKLINWR